METKSQKKPIVVACALALAVALWMFSGLLKETPAVEQSSALARNEEIATQKIAVRVQQLRASEVLREVFLSGRSVPNRRISVKAETDGVVTDISVERGTFVTQGDTILTLDLRDRNARLNEAEAFVTQRQLEFEAVDNLRDQEFTTAVQRAEAHARLEAAKASREKVFLEIKQTTLVAPFDALIQDRSVEVGDYVRAGDSVLELVDINPLIIVGEVNEREVGSLLLGGLGKATLDNGTELEGTIRYIAPVADESTRTFSIELAISNPENKIRAGLTAQLSLYAETIVAHSISPALLSLADDGSIGVKTVDNNNRVQFYPIEIVNSDTNGIQITGLPTSIKLITVGQGFVVPGQEVEPVFDSLINNNSTIE